VLWASSGRGVGLRRAWPPHPRIVFEPFVKSFQLGEYFFCLIFLSTASVHATEKNKSNFQTSCQAQGAARARQPLPDSASTPPVPATPRHYTEHSAHDANVVLCDLSEEEYERARQLVSGSAGPPPIAIEFEEFGDDGAADAGSVSQSKGSWGCTRRQPARCAKHRRSVSTLTATL